jgi:hypothetical protein
MCRALGVFVARRQVFDPPVWCGAATAALFVWGGGGGRPLLSGKLREDGIKVAGILGVSLSGRAFMASQEESRKRLGDREAIFFVSASTIWTKGDLVSTDTTG